MTVAEKIAAFLAAPLFAVAGASNDPINLAIAVLLR